ncbi:hypothetical protein DPSP01_011167 [Paraphaeosphaeria sporulosa]|uniref:Mitochondrial pyruvate carrier n=1 Tax=Paraphaeosphaeria sporulosa TaxID=1460663 RepID=A0A177CJG3_9PLEO|nr:UPF0041-domain-containing protein [Paraphaeosphaeria sporulosa]OAG06927.1 UPF0041-domain-containing protein [Paraphaeosphaeria sporulosa]
MSFRPGSRIFSAFRPFFRQQRNQSTAAPEQSGFAKLWHSPVGPKTVHFWAPIMKWGLVIAGASDLTRPASQLSLNTNAALMTTGLIWTRWCFVIRPQNIFLATVNFFLFLTGATQTTRILMYQRSLKGAEGQAEAEGKEMKEEIKEVAKDVQAKVEKVIKS